MHSTRATVFAPLLACTLLSAVAFAQGPPPPGGPLPPVAPAPPGNPITLAKTNLGKVLFWDEQMGSNQTMACGTCHILGAGGSDPRSAQPGSQSVHPGPNSAFGDADDIFGSRGTTLGQSDGTLELAAIFRLQRQVTTRRSMSAINAGFAPSLFWDGRAQGPFTDPLNGGVVIAQGASLEIQALGPPTNDVEMGHIGRDWNDVAARMSTAEPLRLASNIPPALSAWVNSRTYPELFQEAFGTNAVTPVRIAMAIATYERTLSSNQAPFDQFLANVPGALTPQEQQGLQIFNGVGRCVTCHGGPLLSDNQFHYTGVRPQNDDLGRFAVTGQAVDRGAMRTPTLRNVQLRAPYFHNGRMGTLSDVIDFYDRGGDFNAPNKPNTIAPIGLNAGQRAALLAFLTRPLTDPRVTTQSAPFDRPTLYTETNAVPAHYGAPTAGAGGVAPRLVAFEPPIIGDPTFTVGIDAGNAGRQGVLLISPIQLLAPSPFQGAGLHVALRSGVNVKRIGALSGTGVGTGWGSAKLTLPSDPLMIGQQIFAQWVVLDPLGGGQRLAASDAVAITYL
jgi:cytochrome c peroxidase